MANYQLKSYSPEDKSIGIPRAPILDDKMLLSNVHWFIRVRWIVIIIFLFGSLAGRLFSAKMIKMGFAIPVLPLFVMAVLLFLMNTAFFLFSNKLIEAEHKSITINLWLQIVLDLIFVTSLVYYIGATDTFIPFLYLIHITLSCLFFPKHQSIIIVCIAAFLYLLTVVLQNNGIIIQQTILISDESTGRLNSGVSLILAFSTVFIWFIIWYFISTLSDIVRKRDVELKRANKRLKFAEEEKTKQVLITTHDLKAPFVGIESNISVLKYIHWEELNPVCQNIIDKIEMRSKTLRERIRQILDLGNLRTQFQNEVQTELISLKKVFEEILDEMMDQIIEKKIKLITTILDITVNSNENNLLILFSNLISNAIFYTQNNGTIQISMEEQKSEVIIKISDTGIGIAEKYLDKIFEEYFRTPEAARFNKMSTGLGLQIVKTIIEKLGLSLTVESEINKGTTFTVGIKI